MMPRFSLVHGTVRPYGWQAVYAQYLRRADDPKCFEYLLVIDEDKEDQFHLNIRPGFRAIANCDRPCYIDAANTGTRQSRAPIILQVTDDMFPPEHWDTLLWEAMNEDSSKHVAWVNDGVFPHIQTMQIHTRKWYEKYGYVFKPEYESMLGDHDFTRRALRDGVVLDLRERKDLQWNHLHHRVATRPKDSADRVNESSRRYAQGWAQLEKDWPEQSNGPLIDCLYSDLLNVKTDIQDHMPVLREYARGKEVLELGVRTGVSTVAFLAGRPKRMVSVDIDVSNLDSQVGAAAQLEGIDWTLVEGDSREPRGEFDVIFIDTLHTADQLRAELAVHTPLCREYLIFHDTVIDGKIGEDGKPGLQGPIDELLDTGKWLLDHHYETCNGLMVLRNSSIISDRQKVADSVFGILSKAYRPDASHKEIATAIGKALDKLEDVVSEGVVSPA